MDEIAMAAELPLRDIHLPAAISWWPPAPGWWLLLALVLVVVLLAWWWQRRKAALRVRVAALAEWQALMEAFQQEQNVNQLVQGLSVLLRRVSLSYDPREAVAALSGEAWLRYLDNRHSLSQPNSFSEGVGRLLLTGPYQQQIDGDALALHALCGEWLLRLPGLKAAQR
ncbi:FIG00657500: hypothetical protein [hydrothermal vent metagenome]|uniref:DUF4381 domain-containing protein n=1 Tax=hydrothermal vent metagenome TaxID=652676 RepID=A0A3B0ZSN1_9ZZZZ